MKWKIFPLPSPLLSSKSKYKISSLVFLAAWTRHIIFYPLFNLEHSANSSEKKMTTKSIQILLGINSRSVCPGTANAPGGDPNDWVVLSLVLVSLSLKDCHVLMVVRSGSFTSRAISGPPLSPWQASFPGSAAQSILLVMSDEV